MTTTTTNPVQFDKTKIYIATSEEGYTFRLAFTRTNDMYPEDSLHAGYERHECYDDDYIRYSYHTKENGKGRLETIYPWESGPTTFNVSIEIGS